MNGIVTAFDEYVGLGVVQTEDGKTYPFHCTQIADGTRTVAIGAPVTFVVIARHKGPEAYQITKD